MIMTKRHEGTQFDLLFLERNFRKPSNLNYFRSIWLQEALKIDPVDILIQQKLLLMVLEKNGRFTKVQKL